MNAFNYIAIASLITLLTTLNHKIKSIILIQHGIQLFTRHEMTIGDIKADSLPISSIIWVGWVNSSSILHCNIHVNEYALEIFGTNFLKEFHC